MKVLFAGGGSGGHLMPALALADALHQARPDVEAVLVGASRGIEARLLPDRQPAYRYHLLDMAPVYRRQWWRNVKWVWLAPRLYFACKKLIHREKPALVVGTGGYASGPVLFAAHRAGIPIVLQEQNAYPGLATRIAARWATQIFVGFEEVIPRLGRNRDRAFVTGNPIQTARARNDGESLGIPEGVPVCFVVGGSQGALGINEALSQALDAGELEGVAILWSTGARTFDRFKRHHYPPLRHVRSFWNPIYPAYAVADLIVCRSGAMTLAEIQMWGIPSILIPLPTSAEDHQTDNARAMESRGASVHLPERDLNPPALVRQIRELLSDPARLESMGEAAKSCASPGAAEAIARRLAALLDGESLS